MKNNWKKSFSAFLAVLIVAFMLMTGCSAPAVNENEEPTNATEEETNVVEEETNVSNEETIQLELHETINKMFSNLNDLTQSDVSASLMSITMGDNTWEIFSADSKSEIVSQANYTLEKHPEFNELSDSLQKAGKIILNWYINHNGDLYQGSSAEYYAVQLAIWGYQNGVDPSTLVAEDASGETNEAIIELATLLYNEADSFTYEQPKAQLLWANDKSDANEAVLDYSNLSGEQTVYTFPDDTQKYYRSELLGVVVNGASGKLSFSVSSSDPSVVITDSLNNVVSGFGEGTDHGTGFYVYTPTENTNKTATITVSHVEFAMLGIAAFNSPDSGPLVGRYGYRGSSPDFTLTVKMQ